MKSMKLALLASALAFTPFAAAAQDVGATIYGNDGEPVGTVDQIDEQVVVINTGTHKAPLPVSALYDSAAGRAVNATREQLDTMMAKKIADDMAKRDAALVVGASVVSFGGKPAGTLSKVDLAADSITLDSPDGPVLLTKEYFTVTPEGQLMALVTREQIASAAGSRTAGGGAQ